MAEGRRPERVAELILRELSAMLLRDLKDPLVRKGKKAQQVRLALAALPVRLGLRDLKAQQEIRVLLG